MDNLCRSSTDPTAQKVQTILFQSTAPSEAMLCSLYLISVSRGFERVPTDQLCFCLLNPVYVFQTLGL